MGILVDTNKENINIAIMYIEDKKSHGNIRFHFIRSETELNDFKSQGYKLESELPKTNMPQTTGMPITKIDENKIIHVLETSWRRISWKDQNDIFSRCLKQIADTQGKGRTELDAVLYRDLKLKTCLKRWNLKDERGEEIKVTNENIDRMVPEVALELLSTFDKLTESDLE